MDPKLMTIRNNPNVSEMWSLESGYIPKANQSKYPIAAVDAGEKYGLELTLSVSESDVQFMCGNVHHSFWMSVNMPSEIKEGKGNQLIDLSENFEITIEAEIVRFSKSLRRYKPSRRKCFFNSERSLRFYKTYTLDNCRYECMANFTRKKCGCVKLDMPSTFY